MKFNKGPVSSPFNSSEEVGMTQNPVFKPAVIPFMTFAN
jgi:hypothetical protein